MSNNSAIRVLQVLSGGNNFSGIASYLYQQYKHIDKTQVNYDFLFTEGNSMRLVENDPIFHYSRFYDLGIKHSTVPFYDYFRIARGVRRILIESHYDVLVVNSSVIEVTVACYLALIGIKDVAFIAHAHNSRLYINPKSLRHRLSIIVNPVEQFFRFFLRKKASFLFGCSQSAAIFTFGEKSISQKNFKLVKNAIDFDSFQPNKITRDKVRAENGLKNQAFVFGCVANFTPLKNLRFLILIFNELYKKNNDSQLWLVGDGPEKTRIEQQAKALNIYSNIRFWGQRADVSDIVQGMDAFIFTSFSEGLGMAVIEAQAAGLPTIISNGVPDDVLITSLSRKMPLESSPEDWANAVIEQISRDCDRETIAKELLDSGYDIKSVSKEMTDFYVNNFSRNK